jgi:methionyl-tRNA formyltransferase
MSTDKNLIAIGRSRYIYDGIKHMVAKGYIFKAIITEEAYDEYDIKHTDLEELATTIGANFFMTKKLDLPEIISLIKENNIRVAISVNWKYTIPMSFLNLFECGILNYHLGNLPDYKGNATVNWTIINGESFINGNIHKMDPELDAGDIIARKKIPISRDMYVADILKLAEQDVPELYEKAVAKVLAEPGAYEVKGSVNGMRCYPRLPEDSQIDWKQSTEVIHRLIRASAHPFKGAYSFLNGEKIIIWKATIYNPENKYMAIPGHVVAVQKDTKTIRVACGDGLLELQEIEHNEKVMLPAEFIKSIRVRFKYDANA